MMTMIHTAMTTIPARVGVALTLLSLLAPAGAGAAELVVLTPETWDDYVPAGKEVDAIYGDYVLRNDQLIVVVAQAIPGRHANMTVHDVGGMVIDLTRRDAPNDQLGAYWPGSRHFFTNPRRTSCRADDHVVKGNQSVRLSGREVQLEFDADPVAGKPQLSVRYTLADGDPFLRATTTYANPHDTAVTEELADSIRADRTFTAGNDKATGMFWVHDDWFDQAYGVIVDGYTVKRSDKPTSLLQLIREGTDKVTLKPKETVVVSRSLFPAANSIHLLGTAQRLTGGSPQSIQLTVTDPAGPVANARVALLDKDAKPNEPAYGSGRTDAKGRLRLELPAGRAFIARVEAAGRPAVDAPIRSAAAEAGITLAACGYAAATITDEHGGPIPCKVAFHGTGGTPDPDFGPDSAAVGVKNLHYSHDGRFRRELSPGAYTVLISRGPEYDAIEQEIVVERGRETEIRAMLRRTVDTQGWISADFHSHSSPSGDNTSSQLGRVLNLLCEQIEFAPCTEHNRIDSYDPHLRALGVAHQMATCTGIELTGSPLPVNHQNAFPLILRPRMQDGGGPLPDADPVVQIERLAMWDGGSQKLVQMNHPNLPQILGDRDNDGKVDEGFERMFSFMDVVEVHPPEAILLEPGSAPFTEMKEKPIFHWMQMLNLGYRVTGVVNTDAHYTFHDSGWLRDYIRSKTDDPARIETMDLVHASEAGQLTMTTGPFLEVTLRAGDQTVGPGEDLAARREGVLHVRVQCPNWFDINRVQLFLNGRPAPRLNFTRRTTPERFRDEVVKFDESIPLEFTRDTHVIVAAAGEGLGLGRVMGPTHGKQMPIAVSNPIYVDVGGDGFQPNGDLLDVPVTISPKREPRKQK